LIKSDLFFNFGLCFCSNPKYRKEKPTCPKSVPIRNKIASNILNSKLGGLSQNGRVVPISAGKTDAVQYRFLAS
jgi:hypothetical protein